MNTLTCFLIDDDMDDREIFLSVLEDIAPEAVCETAINGQEAFDKLTAKQVNPDIIFLDLNMPLMNGSQFLKAINGQNGFSHIPIVILTTSSDPKTKEEVMKLGASEFITKPDKLAQWELTLQRTLNDFVRNNR